MRRLQLASDELAAQTQLKEKELETQTQLKQREIEAHERVELEKLKVQNKPVIVERTNVIGVDKGVENAKKALPKFSETTDIDSYLTLFERTMNFKLISANGLPFYNLKSLVK